MSLVYTRETLIVSLIYDCYNNRLHLQTSILEKFMRETSAPINAEREFWKLTCWPTRKESVRIPDNDYTQIAFNYSIFKFFRELLLLRVYILTENTLNLACARWRCIIVYCLQINTYKVSWTHIYSRIETVNLSSILRFNIQLALRIDLWSQITDSSSFYSSIKTLSHILFNIYI